MAIKRKLDAKRQQHFTPYIMPSTLSTLKKETPVDQVPELDRWFKSDFPWAQLQQTHRCLNPILREQVKPESLLAFPTLTVYKRGFSIAILQFACRENNLDNAPELFYFHPSYHRNVIVSKEFLDSLRTRSPQCPDPAHRFVRMMLDKTPKGIFPGSANPNLVNLNLAHTFAFTEILREAVIHCFVINHIAPSWRDWNFALQNAVDILIGLVDPEEHNDTVTWLQQVKDEVPVLTMNGVLPQAYRESLVA